MYRYSEGDDSLVLIDGRDVDVSRFRRRDYVHAVCLMQQVGGVAIVDHSSIADFRMDFYGRDDSGAMAPKAAACAVAFADLLGIKEFNAHDYSLEFGGIVFRVAIDSHMGESKVVRFEENPFHTLCLGPVE